MYSIGLDIKSVPSNFSFKVFKTRKIANTVHKHPQSYCVTPASPMLEKAHRMYLQLLKFIQASSGVNYDRKISFV